MHNRPGPLEDVEMEDVDVYEARLALADLHIADAAANPGGALVEPLGAFLSIYIHIFCLPIAYTWF